MPPFERDPIRRLKKFLAQKNLPRNWEQTVLGWEQLFPNNRTKSNKEKNKLIKNTKVRLLRNFLANYNGKNLPNNWERNFTNVNKPIRNQLVQNRKKSSPPRRATNVPTLKTLMLRLLTNINIIKRGNVKNISAVNIGNRRIHLTQNNIAQLRPGTGVVAAASMIKLRPNQRKKLIPIIKEVYRTQQNQFNKFKNKVIILGIIQGILNKNNSKTKRIVSDLFADTYKLINTLRKKVESSYSGNFYPPLSFVSKYLHPYEPNRLPITVKLYTIGEDEIHTYQEFKELVKRYKERFMHTKLLDASENKRELIWETIRDWRGTLTGCIKACNEIYYGRLKSLH